MRVWYPAVSEACPCGSGVAYEACCGPRHDGSRPAETAVALMCSRYSAFAKGDAAYLLATRVAEGDVDDPAELGRWAKSVSWLGLEVREVIDSADPNEGFVAFTARYLEGEWLVALSERSRFLRREGRWAYVEGKPGVKRVRVPRNEPCPCGSGRKFKHCHA